MGGEITMLSDDLPEDMPSFVARFGSDEQCREYLFKARWPSGFRCAACGHGDAYALKTKIVYECVACRKQHSLLAGTVFEQTKTGSAKWFLAIYLVTSSKGGIAAAELKRQLGLGSYQTAWTWLHKLRKAMVRPDRQPPTWGDAALRLPGIHLVFSLVKRWLLGTHHGAVGEKHLPAYLDEYVFRFNRRTAGSISHGFARLVEHAVMSRPTTYRAIVAAPTP